MNVLGLSAFFHESACCLLRDGRLVAAAEEERFSRVKHDPRLPVVGLPLLPAGGGDRHHGPRRRRLLRVAGQEALPPALGRHSRRGVAGPGLARSARARSGRSARGWAGRGRSSPSITTSPTPPARSSSPGFPKPPCSPSTASASGPPPRTAAGGEPASSCSRRSTSPTPSGLLYATITSYLGFEVNDGEYKVMGLAPYGEPRFLDEMRRLVSPGARGAVPAGSPATSISFAAGGCTRTPCRASSASRRGSPRPRSPASTRTWRGASRRCSRRSCSTRPRWLHERTGLPDLCMAGGVALNVVANGRILREGPFERLFVQPAAGDSGACLGAAALAHVELTGGAGRSPLRHVYLGPRWTLRRDRRPARRRPGSPPRTSAAARPSCWRRWSTGWRPARWSAGSTAPWRSAPARSAARSLLADPARSRDARPAEPAGQEARGVPPLRAERPRRPRGRALRPRSPLPLHAGDLPGDLAARPAGDHPRRRLGPPADGRSARSRPRFAALLEAFRRRTGCPLLVNTSFNVRGEPIVASPVDALSCLGVSGIDALVLEDFLIDRAGCRRTGPTSSPPGASAPAAASPADERRDQRGPLHASYESRLFDRLADLLATPEGLRTARLLQAAGLLGAPSRGAPSAPPLRRSRSASGEPQEVDGETVWSAPIRCRSATTIAATKVLRPQEAELPLRVAFFGESVAAGYLYAPHLTPARVLEAQLRALGGAANFEVIDLARTNETLPSLAETVRASLQIQPGRPRPLRRQQLEPAGDAGGLPLRPVRRRRASATARRCGRKGSRGRSRRAAERLRAGGGSGARRHRGDRLGGPHPRRGGDPRGQSRRLGDAPAAGLAGRRRHRPLARPLRGGRRTPRRARTSRSALATAQALRELDGGACSSTWRLLARAHLGLGDLEDARRACLRRGRRRPLRHPRLPERAAGHHRGPRAAAGCRPPARLPRRGPAGRLRRAHRLDPPRPPPLPRLLPSDPGGDPGRHGRRGRPGAQPLGDARGDAGLARVSSPASPPAISPEAEATARFGAAIHTAHRLLSTGSKRPILEHWCEAALDASPGIAGDDARPRRRPLRPLPRRADRGPAAQPRLPLPPHSSSTAGAGTTSTPT